MTKINCSRFLFLLYGALLLALFSPIIAAAQDDFFPPPGIFIPCCSSGGTGGHTGATYGENGQSAWKQVWGAAPGDIVTFQFVLRARSAGSLHAWPQTTGGDNMQYLGDPNNQYEKWYWNTGERDSGGTFCIDCPWQFVANTHNPWIYIDYWDSGDGWDVDLNVVNISTPPKSPPLVSLFTKNQAGTLSQLSSIFGSVFTIGGGGMMISPVPGAVPIGFVVVGIGYVNDKYLVPYFDKIKADPFDWEFSTIYDAYVDPQLEQDMAWICPAVEQYDNTAGWLPAMCRQTVEALLQVEALMKAIGVTNDRFESCLLMGDSCDVYQREKGVSYFHASADWLNWLGYLESIWAQHMYNWNISYYEPNTGRDMQTTFQEIGGLHQWAAQTFWGVQ